MVTLRVFTTRRLIRCTRFDGSCLRIFAAKCSTDKKLGSTDSHWVLSYRGKDPRKPKRFSWSVQGSLRGNRNPLRLFFFCQRFLLEKQKKMLCRSCKFAAVHRPLCSFPETPEASPMRGSCRRKATDEVGAGDPSRAKTGRPCGRPVGVRGIISSLRLLFPD